MTQPLPHQLRDIARALEQIDTTDPIEAVKQLSAAHQMLTTTLDEAMAVAAVEGESMRTIGAAAGLAPNSIPPRLARSRTLGDYSEVDKPRVTLEGVARARHDYRTGAAPLRFTSRKSTRGGTDD